MTKPHPVLALKAKLETARLTAIETLASNADAISPDSLRDLGAIQIALTAISEVIEGHGVRLGWAGIPDALV